MSHNALLRIVHVCFDPWPNYNHTQRAHYNHHGYIHPREYKYYNPVPPCKKYVLRSRCQNCHGVLTSQSHKNKNSALCKFRWHNPEHRRVQNKDCRNWKFRWTFGSTHFDKLPFRWSHKDTSKLSAERKLRILTKQNKICNDYFRAQNSLCFVNKNSKRFKRSSKSI